MKKYLSCLKPYTIQGYCNKIYLAHYKDKRYIVRELLNKEVDRAAEYKIQQRASKLNFAPQIVAFDDRYMVSRFVDGKHHTKLDRSKLRYIAKILRKLHKQHIRSKRVDLKKLLSYKNYHLIRASKRFRSNLALTHNDLNSKNIIFGDKIYLIDFEYAMRGDIYFDLASICVEFDLDRSSEVYFLKRYFQSDKFDLKKIKLYKSIYQEAVKEWFRKK